MVICRSVSCVSLNGCAVRKYGMAVFVFYRYFVFYEKEVDSKV